MKTDAQKREAFKAAKLHIIHCIRNDLPHELDGVYVIMDGVGLPYKVHDLIQDIKRHWARLKQ